VDITGDDVISDQTVNDRCFWFTDSVYRVNIECLFW